MGTTSVAAMMAPRPTPAAAVLVAGIVDSDHRRVAYIFQRGRMRFGQCQRKLCVAAFDQKSLAYAQLENVGEEPGNSGIAHMTAALEIADEADHTRGEEALSANDFWQLCFDDAAVGPSVKPDPVVYDCIRLFGKINLDPGRFSFIQRRQITPTDLGRGQFMYDRLINLIGCKRLTRMFLVAGPAAAFGLAAFAAWRPRIDNIARRRLRRVGGISLQPSDLLLELANSRPELHVLLSEHAIELHQFRNDPVFVVHEVSYTRTFRIAQVGICGFSKSSEKKTCEGLPLPDHQVIICNSLKSNCERTNHAKSHYRRALAASPLMLGGVLYTMDGFSLSLFTHPDILKCNQNGVIGKLTHRNGKIEVWKTLEYDNEKNGWIGIFNRDGKAKMSVDKSIEELGLEAGLDYMLKDIWAGKTLPVSQKHTFEIPADGVVFLRYEQTE